MIFDSPLEYLFTEAKVSYLNVKIIIHKEVFRLEVTMAEESILVHVVKRIDQLAKYIQGGLLTQVTCAYELVQVLLLSEIH